MKSARLLRHDQKWQQQLFCLECQDCVWIGRRDLFIFKDDNYNPPDQVGCKCPACGNHINMDAVTNQWRKMRLPDYETWCAAQQPAAPALQSGEFSSL